VPGSSPSITQSSEMVSADADEKPGEGVQRSVATLRDKQEESRQLASQQTSGLADAPSRANTSTRAIAASMLSNRED